MTKFKPLVSVIIPMFNEKQTIRGCIETLLNQTYPNTEIIVIDDGSGDGSVDEIANLPVQLLLQTHKGPAVARNKGVEKARGEIVVFVDADMTFSKKFIEDLVLPIINSISKGTFSREEFISNWDNVWSRCWNFNQNLPYRKMIPENYPDKGRDFRAILKSEFLKVGGFDNVGYTDTWTLSEKLNSRPDAVKGAVYYHGNPDSLKNVFSQAKWVAKRSYKLGFLGIFFTLLKSLLLASLIVGVVKSIRYRELRFIFFKVVYDFAISLGILEMVFWGKLSK